MAICRGTTTLRELFFCLRSATRMPNARPLRAEWPQCDLAQLHVDELLQALLAWKQTVISCGSMAPGDQPHQRASSSRTLVRTFFMRRKQSARRWKLHPARSRFFCRWRPGLEMGADVGDQPTRSASAVGLQFGESFERRSESNHDLLSCSRAVR